MKITIAKHSGFCFGVKRAYDLACAGSRSRGKVYILGKLVHNDDVCRDLRKKRIKEIKSLNEAKEGTIIFTAHGVGPRLYEKVIKKGLKIIDTTCPKVVKAQRLAKNYAKKGYQVIVFGDEKHEEVKGIWEWSGDKVKIIGSLKEAKKLKLEKKKKYCL
ncbi:MAG: bifunctional 4-hydroxy-3-methylbut-2-enyl diphosphate reductase/30S ribosomal protein S1, partial [Candidatus Moranbacteria bacterium CG_4_10_14_3_um_filter_44_15]